MLTIKRVLHDGTTIIESAKEFVFCPANDGNPDTYCLTDESGIKKVTEINCGPLTIYVMNAAGATVETIRL